MLKTYSFQSQPKKLITKYIQMLRDGLTPNEHTYPSLLKSISHSDNKNPNQIHAQILKSGFGCDSFVRNSLVSCYAKGGDLGNACELFDEIFHKDSVSWTAMIHGYVKNGRADEGLRVFVEMRSLGVEIDEMVIVSVLNGSGIVRNIWFGKTIHGFYVECGRVKWDVYIGTALVDMYLKCGRCDDARKLFEEMHCRNVVSWTALISGYVQCNRVRDAIFIFQDMISEGLKPNEVTLASVLSAVGQIGALEEGRWIHGYIIRNNLGLNSIIETALIDMYAKCGCINHAFEIFHKLPQKDVYPWTALINGLAMHGLASKCLELFSQMLTEGVRPNEVTLIGVLCACSHGGLVDQGRRFFVHMFEDYGIKPNLEHFGCMVDLLGRAGHLEEAMQLIECMPMEPSAGVWGALFGACMIHKDFVLGERIGKYLVGIQPDNGGRYALLTNMYSLSQKWQEAANLRMAMRGRRVEKTRGCSWLEVNGILHEFISSDESHCKMKDVYETLDGMAILMKLESSDSHLRLFDMDVR